jgi:hypothetical protein
MAFSRYPGLVAWPEASETGGMKPPPDPHCCQRFAAEINRFQAIEIDHTHFIAYKDQGIA